MKKNQRSDLLLCCVVVGASAYGKSALRQFLEDLKGEKKLRGISIVIQTEGEDEKSLEAISGFKDLKVCVDEGSIQPGKIYRAAANSQLTFSGKKFQVKLPGEKMAPSSAIDLMLHSAANVFGEACMVVMLSDRISTAILGRESVSTAGGVILAPDGIEDSEDEIALFADIVVPLEELADALLSHAGRHQKPKNIEEKPGKEAFNEICSIVREETGHDFKHYKESTLSRRVMRRVGILQCPDVEAYVQFLKHNPEESRILMRDLLIGVTAFFRDRKAFSALREKILKKLIGSEDNSPVRIWVAGCSKGQEAYSIAMLALEVKDELLSDREVLIFATDLDERALSVARKGLYPASIASEVSPSQLDRFFQKTARGYQVTKELRQMVSFTPHNLIADPPFSRMDVISCRNLLIYLGPHLQKKLMSVFHYGLRDGGYLFLGSSEAVSGHGDLFRVVDTKNRIAQRKDTVIRNAGSGHSSGGKLTSVWQPLAEAREIDLGAVAQRILLDEFSPPFVIANADGRVIYLSGGTDEFLQPPEGQFVNHIMRMARSGLRVGLRSAWNKAVKTRSTQTYEGLTVESANGKRGIKIVVQPMPELGEEDGSNMVVFIDRGLVKKGEAGRVDTAASERLVEQLEAELLHTREELERTVQDLEAANEELKSSNEELLSMNEELQSANEEMETSKEEIEAAAQALSASHSDLVNFLQSTEIATIFLDENGLLKNFTPKASELFNIRNGDTGRPLSDFTHRFTNLPELPELEKVARAKEPIEDQVITKDGKTYLRRITPYQTDEGGSSGIVITFVDVSDQQNMLEQLALAFAEIEAIYDHAPVGLAIIDRDLKFYRVNEALASMNGHPAKYHKGKSIFDVVPDLAQEAEEMFSRVLNNGETVGPFELEGTTDATSGKTHTWMETFAPLTDDAGNINGVLVTALDITDRKENEVAQAISEKRLRRIIDQIVTFIGTLRPDGTLTEANEAAVAASGLPREELIGKPFWECYWWSYSLAVQRQLKAVIKKAAGGETLRYDVDVRVAGDNRITIDFQIGPVYDDDGNLVELAVSGADITDRKRYFEQLRENEERLQLAVDSAQFGVFNYDAIRDEVVWDERTCELFDAPPDMKMPFKVEYMLERIHPDHHAYVMKKLEHTFDPQGDGLYRAEHRINTRDGSVRWVAVHGQTRFTGVGKDRRALKTNGVSRDITGRKEAERAYAESFERLELALEVGRMGIWDWNVVDNKLEWTDGINVISGFEPGEVEPGFKVWINSVHEEDRDQVVAALAKAREEKTEFTSTHRQVWKDGTIVYSSARGRFIYDEAGEPVRMLGILEDVTELKKIDMQRELLLGELNHRVKNSLATIQAMASHTLRNTPDPEEFHEKFLGRLRAISAAHEILTDRNRKQASLVELIEKQIGPYADLKSNRIRMNGPKVDLSPTSAHALGLVLHELTTNAAKYGALSNNDGFIDIKWKLYDEKNVKMVEILWTEHGGPHVNEPETTGFGSRLIKQSLAYSLGGRSELNFPREGLQAVLAVPARADYEQ